MESYISSCLEDLAIPGVIVEAKSGIRAIRSLHAALFRFADIALRNEDKDAYLILLNPLLSKERLTAEWEIASRILVPATESRLFLVVYKGIEIIWKSPGVSPEHIEIIKRYCDAEINQAIQRLPKPDYEAEVLKTLLNAWIQSSKRKSSWIAGDKLSFIEEKCLTDELLTKVKIEKIVGCTYRPIEEAIASLGNSVERFGNKGLRLKYFPRYSWERMVVLADKSRSTMKFTDTSGYPRLPDSLKKRLLKLNNPYVALAGVTGTLRIFPELNITGSPRFDLTIHAPNGCTDTSFVRQLDPALREWRRGDPPPTVVLHFLRRKMSFFRRDDKGALWADPIECMMDLHEAKLESQALQFRNAILPEDART